MSRSGIPPKMFKGTPEGRRRYARMYHALHPDRTGRAKAQKEFEESLVTQSNFDNVSDPTTEPDRIVSSIEKLNHIQAAIEGDAVLTKREQLIIQYRLKNFTFERIGNYMGLSRERIWQIMNNGLKKLMEHLELSDEEKR